MSLMSRRPRLKKSGSVVIPAGMARKCRMTYAALQRRCIGRCLVALQGQSAQERQILNPNVVSPGQGEIGANRILRPCLILVNFYEFKNPEPHFLRESLEDESHYSHSLANEPPDRSCEPLSTALHVPRLELTDIVSRARHPYSRAGVVHASLNTPLDVHPLAAFLADKRFDGA